MSSLTCPIVRSLGVLVALALACSTRPLETDSDTDGPDHECLRWFPEGDALPGLENLGVCGTAP